MSLFRGINGEFSPLFRLLDDYASHTATRGGFPSASSSVRSFSPKFDVKESKETYELHGEIPGVEQNQINIEFVDPQTIQISGRVEHRHIRGQPPAGFVEGQQDEQGKIEGGDGNHYHKPTVEDAGNEGGSQSAVQKPDQSKLTKRGEEERWWITERSVGEFSRVFSFPSRVDQDKVSASLKNGVLQVVVPKAKPEKGRKIAINA